MSSFVACRDSSCRTQMDLLKPSEGAERAIDTLHHYHITSEQTGVSIADGVTGNIAETCGNIFFRVSKVICSQATQIQDPAHMQWQLVPLHGSTQAMWSGVHCQCWSLVFPCKSSICVRHGILAQVLLARKDLRGAEAAAREKMQWQPAPLHSLTWVVWSGVHWH